MSQLASSSNPTLRDYFDKTNLGELLERLVVDLGEERPSDVLAFIEKWAGDQRRNGRRPSAAAAPHQQATVSDSGSVANAAREVWRSAGASTGANVAKHFFDVLFTQHASLRRKLFTGVDVDVAKAALGPVLSQAVTGDVDAAAIGALAKTHGLGRGAEQKHFHYFLTAALTATSIVIGADSFGPVADGFRVVFTAIGDAVMVGLGIKAAPDASATGANQTSLAEQWSGIADRAAVVKKMLAILKVQHATLKKRVLADTDDDVIAAAVAEALTAQIAGNLSDDAIVALGTQYGTGRSVQRRHFDYLLCAGLFAIQTSVGKEAFAETHNAWNAKLAHICDLLCQGACGTATAGGAADCEPQLVGPGVGTSSSGAVNAKEAMAALADRPAFDVAFDSWAGVADKPQLIMRFYAVLLTQHRSLCNTVLKDIDLEAIAPAVADLITALLDGSRPLTDLYALGAEHGKPRGAQLKHLHYALSAALTAFSITLGETYPAVADHWKTVLTTFVDEFAAGAVTGDSATPQEQMSLSMAPVQPTAGGGGGGGSSTKEEEQEVLTRDKERVYSDAECIELTRKSWAALGEAGKRRDVADNFFAVLLTQHPTVKRKLFAGLEPDALAPLLEAQLDAAITSDAFPSLPAITALAKQHGSPRGPLEMRHYHYFLSAGLAAVAIVVGRKEFPAVAEPWRRVLTLIMQEVMAGAPAVDAAAEQHQEPPKL